MKLAFCFPGDNFSGGFVESWSRTIPALMDAGIEVPILSRCYSADVAQARLSCLGPRRDASGAWRVFGGAAVDLIFWIDSDIVWTVDDISTIIYAMIQHPEIDILSGLYPMAPSGPFAAFRAAGDPLTPSESLGASPVAVDYCGMGFMATRPRVYEAVAYPWFARTLTTNGDLMSEDAAFGRAAAAAGIATYVHPLVDLRHEKRVRF